MKKLLDKVYSDLAKKGFKQVVNRKYLKELYYKYTK